MSDSFVDLLLVRLGREEEKKKVLKLLITSLDLSVTEAENAVNNSPSVIKEAVPMNKARIIQKDLYPYIDLLPRLDAEVEESSGADESAGDEPDSSPPEIEYTKIEGEQRKEVVSSAVELDENEVADDVPETLPDDDTPAPVADEEEAAADDDDDVIEITTASEEMRVASRCHICGRTPTDGEKLAPCRTCGELTCRNCFDRVAHVCNHCAKDGKTVDRANAGINDDEEEGLEFDTEEPREDDSVQSSTNYLKIAGISAFVIILAAAFYFLDPMGFFSRKRSVASVAPVAVIAEIDTNTTVTDDSISIDITEVQVDTAATSVVDSLTSDDPFGLHLIALSDSCIPSENPSSLDYQTEVPDEINAVVPVESSEIIFRQLELLTSSLPVVVDNGALLVYNDTTAVLVLVLLHPEETEMRMQLMREVAALLIPTEIEQFVLIYRENRYQDAALFSLLSESFSSVEGVMSPRHFQEMMDYREDCWESISGPVVHWLSSVE